MTEPPKTLVSSLFLFSAYCFLFYNMVSEPLFDACQDFCCCVFCCFFGCALLMVLGCSLYFFVGLLCVDSCVWQCCCCCCLLLWRSLFGPLCLIFLSHDRKLPNQLVLYFVFGLGYICYLVKMLERAVIFNILVSSSLWLLQLSLSLLFCESAAPHIVVVVHGCCTYCVLWNNSTTYCSSGCLLLLYLQAGFQLEGEC